MSCGCSCNDAYELPKGEKGDQGPQGEKGTTGNTGAKGDQGVQGIQGVQGDPAFKYFKTVNPLGSPTYNFVSASEYTTYISGNLTDSVDGTVATAIDYSYTILRFDGAGYRNAFLDGSVTDVSISASTGVMTVTIGPGFETDLYRLIIVG